MNTQVSLILTKTDAMKLASDLLIAANRMTGEKDESIRIHSFGQHVGAWKVDEPIVAGM